MSRGLALLVLGLCFLSCSTGASSSAPVSPGAAPTIPATDLPVTVSSSSHLLELHLPQGWTASLALNAQEPDAVSGSGGTITVMLTALPAGIAPSDWIDSYLDIHAADFPSGCLSGGGAPQEKVSIGGDDARLLELGCLPGWMLIVAHDDRLYDLRFKVSGGTTAAEKATFIAIGQRLAFLPGAMPSSPPTTLPSATP